ncbi:MAG TPA: universal stress protein [Ktedonobacterales bacterium]|nr:universal stress protein [Ktedonobacterales bacterium]
MRDRDLAGTHIMVPLDGSELAEQALPSAGYIASALRATLVLVRIVPPTHVASAPPDGRTVAQWYQAMMSEELRAARTYLDGLALPLRQRGLRVQVITQQGMAGPTLVDLLSALNIGLVVMTTRGRSGMTLFALGSVADHLVRGSHTPIFLLRPQTGSRRAERFERAIIPLDGSERAEAELDLAAALSGSLIRAITLLRVVPRQGRPAAGHPVTEARQYLQSVNEQLTDQVAGRAIVRTQVDVGDPAEHIIRRAESDCDLLIMASHGEVGARRWALGSVADRVLHDSGTPLMLIVPPQGGERLTHQPESAITVRPGARSGEGAAMNTEDESEREIEREMKSSTPSTPEEQARESGAPGGGAGRTDVPGHTGVYPLSASEGASREAQVRGEPAWGQGERGAAGYEDSGDSSLEAFTPPRESEGADDTRPSAQ